MHSHLWYFKDSLLLKQLFFIKIKYPLSKVNVSILYCIEACENVGGHSKTVHFFVTLCMLL